MVWPVDGGGAVCPGGGVCCHCWAGGMPSAESFLHPRTRRGASTSQRIARLYSQIGRFLAPLRLRPVASGMHRGCLLAAALVACPALAVADETSATDKLRILYSTRFTFTDDGLPLVTVEIMGGRKEIKL